MTPATDAERALDNRIEELAAMGFGVLVERIEDGLQGGWLNTGWRWRAHLKRNGFNYAESGGKTAEEALEHAIEGARGQGARL